ncbi:MAG: ATP-binding cassette domain-containing protein, partial [Erysipelotrichia bacterium]|nr:ATP-binding cassette domain-containing protein [Erysipelotrichia bacterium]
MIFIYTLAISLAPTYEGLVTTQLAEDVMNATDTSNIVISYEVILKLGCILLGIYLVKTIAQMICITYLTNAIQNAMADLRNAIQAKIRRLPVSYFDNHHFGDVLSRITNDIDAISNALQQVFTQLVSGVLMIIMAIYMMFTLNIQMTFIACLMIPAMLLITKTIVKYSQKLFRKQQDALGELNGAITEMYTGYNEILLFNHQAKSINEFKSINENLRSNAFKAQFVSSAIGPLNGLVTYLIIGAIAVIGILQVISGQFAIGELQAFIRYIWQVNDPLSQVSSLSSQIQSAFAALGRVIEILNESEEVKEKEDAKRLEDVKGNVSFEHVQFGYYDKNLMNDFNVEVKSGQMVAIVGPTGAGKSVLLGSNRWQNFQLAIYNGQIIRLAYHNGKNRSDFMVPYQFTPGKWYQLAVTQNKEGIIDFYVNGKLVMSRDAEKKFPAQSAHIAVIGSYHINSKGSFDHVFKGYIDRPRLHDFYLTSDFVRQDWEKGNQTLPLIPMPQQVHMADGGKDWKRPSALQIAPLPPAYSNRNYAYKKLAEGLKSKKIPIVKNGAAKLVLAAPDSKDIPAELQEYT